jgi:diguanylate cyclase (GGDEF)-like protein/PAS domain S-box-containing protein
MMDTLPKNPKPRIKDLVLRKLFSALLLNATRANGSLDRDTLLSTVATSDLATLVISQASAERLGVLLETMPQGICFFDGEQRLIVSNSRFAEIYGLDPDQIKPSAEFRAILDQRYLAGTLPAMTRSEYLHWHNKVGQDHKPTTSVIELQNGQVISIRYQPMPDQGWVAIHEDITDQLTIERGINHRGSHDELTGLPNRLELAARLKKLLIHVSSAAPCAVLSLCLDGLRAVNDTRGRLAGEDLLRNAAGRLRQNLPRDALLGVQGANEFVIVQSSVDTPAAVSQLADRMSELFAEPIMVEGKPLFVSARIGASIADVGGLTADTVMKQANIALYFATTETGCRYRLFEPEMDIVLQARHLLEVDLRAAVAGMTFELEYQPQINVRSKRITGFEALLRWNHSVHGPILPTRFIALAEELGLISEIGRWVLHQACCAAAAWPDGIGVAVNVSILQFEDDALLDAVLTALTLSGLAPARLELEITETCMAQNPGRIAAILSRLRSSGVRIAMDDFGTGYSSLSSLPALSFDKIKIDQKFVASLGQGSAPTAIIRAIVSLCVSLGVECLAEGVETEEQLALLVREKCTSVQGFLLGRPCSALDVPSVLFGAETSRLARFERSFFTYAAEETARSPYGSGFSFAQIVGTANDIIIVTDAVLDPPGPTILYVNDAFTRITGFQAHEAIGRSPRMLQGPGTSRATLDSIAASLRAGESASHTVLNYAKNGSPYWLDMRIVPLLDDMGRVYQFVAIERDITLQKRHLNELEYLADRDTLTGIPNRRALLRSMNAELRNWRERPGTGPCLAYIDVDYFKTINDQHGHAIGDAVLFGFADRLIENARRMDIVGRLGGDEFAVFMPAVTLPEAAGISERLRGAIAAEPFETPAGPVRVSVSVGVSEAEPHNCDLSDLLKRADLAMYTAKQSGRDRVVMAAQSR